MHHHPPTPTLFPYTTLFRSDRPTMQADLEPLATPRYVEIRTGHFDAERSSLCKPGCAASVQDVEARAPRFDVHVRRSEERRVGKVGRSRWRPTHVKTKACKT